MFKNLALATMVGSLLAGCITDDPEVGNDQQQIRFNDPDPTVPVPPAPDPEPACSSSARMVSVSSDRLQTELPTLLRFTRIQLSHFGRGETATGEPRTLVLRRNIPAYKIDQFINNIERQCASKPNPSQCFIDRMSALNDPVVHTITPVYNSYIRWSPVVAEVLGKSVQPLPIKVVKKTLIHKWWLKYPLPGSVTEARCSMNNIHHVVDYGDGTEFRLSGNALRIKIPLSTGNPALKCDGYGRFFGIGVGWADELFPDVNLKNPNVVLSFGAFRAENGRIVYKVSRGFFNGSVDLNNIPGPIEDFIDLLTWFRDKIDNKVEARLQKATEDSRVREGIGRMLEREASTAAGGSSLAGRICDVKVGGGQMRVWYEPN